MWNDFSKSVWISFRAMSLLRQFPALVILLLLSAALMLVPALYASARENWLVARVFLLHSVFFFIVGIILGLATMNRVPRVPASYHLLTLLLAYILIPLVLASPLVPLTPGLGAGARYFEMISCLTTTGATLMEPPSHYSESVHLWRSIVGWAGGFTILVTAFAILAPLSLGGFEIGEGTAKRSDRRYTSMSIDEASHRITHHAQLIAPAYAVFTGVLALLLVFSGDRPFVAITHAMAAISTSGISPVGGLQGARSGIAGEFAIAIFLLLAVSHRAMSFDAWRRNRPGISDPEVQLMLISVLGITLLLFLHAFIGAVGLDRQDDLPAALHAIWGSLFTTLSFLTTTGFESQDWQTMRIWSNLPSPGTILLGLAVMGGGIATTAGGVKLLRLYALYRLGLRELDLLVHPSSVPRRGWGDKLIARGASRIAFIFLMLFLVALALVMIMLSATGLTFERSLTLAIAGLTTTGPAIRTLGDGMTYSDLNATARLILSFAMIVGRMEALVIFALFNPVFWKN
jgi:trk system potassium uptake protein TrkH